MADLDTTTAAAVLEELYFEDGIINDMIMRDCPTLLMMKHETNGGGEGWHLPVKVVMPQGISRTYGGITSTPSDYKKFVGNFPEVVGKVTVSGSLLRKAKGNRVLMVNHIESEVDGALYTIKQELGVEVFGNGGGSKGQESGVWTSGNTIVLQEGEAYHFEPGEIIQSAATDGNSGSVRAGSATIVSVDPDNDTIVVDDITGITGFAQDDYIFRSGYFGSTSSAMSGIQGWIPLTPGTFRGVDQTLNPNRLAGTRHSGSANIVDSLVKLDSKIRGNRVNAKVDYGVLNPEDFGDLRVELEDRKRLVEGRMTGKGDFEHLGVDTIKVGNAQIYEDIACPVGHGFLFSSDKWNYRTVGEMVQVIQDDGLKFVRVGTDDVFEARLWSAGDVLCHNPGANGRVTLP